VKRAFQNELTRQDPHQSRPVKRNHVCAKRRLRAGCIAEVKGAAMPARILREGILTSESVDQLSPGAELFYRRLMSAVDDYGRYPKHPSLLRAALFPLRTDKITSDDITGWLNECERAGLIQTFLSQGKACIEIVNFKQRVRSQSKYPRAEDSQMSDR
jgi:hypothetical protein